MRLSDGYQCNSNSSHLTCSNCYVLFPDWNIYNNQKCVICISPLCNLYF